MAFNWDEIRPDIVIGTCPMNEDDVKAIRDDAKAKAILSLQEERCRHDLAIDFAEITTAAERDGLPLVNVPMRDFDAQHQAEQLLTSVRALRTLLDKHGRVYVHCTVGINRGPLCVLGYFTFVEGRSFKEALALIVQGRPDVAPYQEAWESARETLLRLHRDRVIERAKLLYNQNPNRRAQNNWFRAEREILEELTRPNTKVTTADPEADEAPPAPAKKKSSRRAKARA